MDWNELIERLMQKFELETDKDLAAVLGLVPSQIYNWRAGRTELGPLVKLTILDKLGYAYAREALLQIAPERLAAKIVNKDNRRALSKKPRPKSQLNTLSSKNGQEGGNAAANADQVQAPTLGEEQSQVRAHKAVSKRKAPARKKATD